METTDPLPTGIEADPQPAPANAPASETAVDIRRLNLNAQHLRLTQVGLMDQTDAHNELVWEREWLLHPSERELSLTGNLFVVHDQLSHHGFVFVNTAPLPHARPGESGPDLRVHATSGSGFEFVMTDDHAEWDVLEYDGDTFERTRVLQSWQRQFRPETAAHAPNFLTNTWGDRSRDSRIQHAFVASEIEAAARLGADIVQIDDGWQCGVTSNSARAAESGGVWEGFWNANPNFWRVNPDRFPQGLQPLIDQAREHGMALGLWFAPDSWHDFAHWRRDADCLLDMFRKLDVRHFKIDGVQAATAAAQANLRRFFDAVRQGSHGEIALDLDITAQTRPGYFGAMDVGPLFLENRYTDWHNYWPHQTLRNLWKLSHWVDPSRLRMEFLNNTRNQENYPADPLSPVRYTPEALFATVCFSNPLGWFECSNLPDAYTVGLPSMIATWKHHREDIFSGTILPVGHAPDGIAWTGFVAIAEDCVHGWAVLFRELNPVPEYTFRLPAPIHVNSCRTLSGTGSCKAHDGGLAVAIPETLGYLLLEFDSGCLTD